MAKKSGRNKGKSSGAAPTGWKRLYNAIDAFTAAEPWRKFENEDVFIVSDPTDNMMYLCCVMGNGGMEFGLNAYRGREGMRNFLDMMDMQGGPPPRHFVYEINMLSLSLEKKSMLERKDLAVTKKLLRTYPGGRWPLLRSYQPHWAPWFLDQREVTAMSHCLEQTVALGRMEDGLETVRNVPTEHVLVRYQDESGSWTSDAMVVSVPDHETVREITLDDITLQRLQDLPADLPAEEIDLVNLPMPVNDKGRPYFPLGVASMNASGFANQYGLFAPDEDYLTGSVQSVINAFLERGYLPNEVVLRENSLFAEAFMPVCRKAGISCRLEDELEAITDFMEGMEKHMDGMS